MNGPQGETAFIVPCGRTSYMYASRVRMTSQAVMI